MNDTITVILERAVARLGLALALAFAITVSPTVAHALWTGGPIHAVESLVTLSSWIINDFRPW